MSGIPSDIRETIFSPAVITEANKAFCLPEGRLHALLDAAAALVRQDAAQELAERFHGLFFHSAMDVEEAVKLWKEQGAQLGPLQPALGALLVVSGLPAMREFYSGHGIPDAVLRDGLRDLNIWMDDCMEKTGLTGLDEVGWLLRSIRGNVIRLGRLQFCRQLLSWNITVATRNADGLALAFFPKPERIREDGQIDGTNGIHSACAAVTSHTVDAQFIGGTPIHPGGYAEHRLLHLPAEEWTVAVTPGVWSLDIHIPKDGKMTLEQCRDSIRTALSFYPRHFPDQAIRIITLCTWFLDAQLQHLLPADSNIVQFQREFYLFPVLSDERATYERVFGNTEVDIETAPEDSGLRRAIKKHVLAGGRMRYNAGFILPGDIANFGEARYQTITGAFIAKELGGERY